METLVTLREREWRVIWGGALRRCAAPSHAAPNSRCQCSRKLSRRLSLSMLCGGAGLGSGSSGTPRGLCGVYSHQMGATGPTVARGRVTWVLAGGVLAAALVLGAGPRAFPPAFQAVGPESPSRTGPSGPQPSAQVRGPGFWVCKHPLEESRPVDHVEGEAESLPGGASRCVLYVPRNWNSRTGRASGLVALGS